MMGKPTNEDIEMLSDPAFDDMTIILDDGRVVSQSAVMLELCHVVDELADKLHDAEIATDYLPDLKRLAAHMIDGINKAINYDPDHNARVAAIALANGYVKAKDRDALAKSAGCMKFDAEEVVYLMAAVEKMKCDDCKGHCAISNNNRCLYHTLRTKLEALKEARDEI